MNRANARIRRPVALVMALLALVLTTCVWASQTPTTTLPPPIDLADPANIEAGRQMFNVTCTHYCHGKDARGSGLRGPSLRNGGFDNWYLYGRISGGRPPMPAFAGIYTPEQIWRIIAYIQSLRD